MKKTSTPKNGKAKKRPETTAKAKATLANLRQETDPRAAALRRSQDCETEVEEVLKRHNCRLAPFIEDPQRIGNDGRQMMVTASVMVVPNEV